MGYPDTAQGFMVKDQKKWQEFHKEEFKLKPFEDRDIDIAIECCGVCASIYLVQFYINGSTS